jgi:hypothetical protein
MLYKTALELYNAKPQGEGGPRAGHALMAYLLCPFSGKIVKLLTDVFCLP